jgi:prefoldin subunit 5
MTLDKYLQIAILVILAALLWRDNRLEKRREAEKDRNLASSFNNLKDCLDNGLRSALFAINSNISSNLSDLHKILTFLPSESSISSLLKANLDGVQTKLLATLQAQDAQIQNLASSIPTIESIKSILAPLETPIKLWGEAKTKHVINEGEANRTLRKKLQDKREYITEINSQLSTLNSQLKSTRSELSEVKSEAASFMAALVAEVDFMRSWLDSKGMPLSALDKALDMEFKAQIPSREYHKVKSQNDLQKSLTMEAVPGIMPLQSTPPLDIPTSRPLDPSQEVANA